MQRRKRRKGASNGVHEWASRRAPAATLVVNAPSCHHRIELARAAGARGRARGRAVAAHSALGVQHGFAEVARLPPLISASLINWTIRQFGGKWERGDPFLDLCTFFIVAAVGNEAAEMGALAQQAPNAHTTTTTSSISTSSTISNVVGRAIAHRRCGRYHPHGAGREPGERANPRRHCRPEPRRAGGTSLGA